MGRGLEAEAATEAGHQIAQLAAFRARNPLARGEALRRLEHDRDALMGFYAGAVREWLEDVSPEERHRVCKPLRLDVRFRPDWPPEISGIFAEVAEEAEAGLSNRNPSPRSV